MTENGSFEVNNSRSNKAVKIIRIDKTAPEITITEEKIIGGKELTIELTDNIGLAEYTIIKPTETEEKEATKVEGELTNGIINMQVTEEGTYTVKVIDIAGNKTTKTITVEIEEPTPPESPDVPVEPEPETYTVTYNPGEQGTFEEQTYQYLNKGDETPRFEGELTCNKGYEFDCWKTEEGEAISETVERDIIYIAQWKKKEYSVTFKGRNDSNIDVQTVEHGESATVPDLEAEEFKQYKEGSELAKDKNEQGESYGIYYNFKAWEIEEIELTEEELTEEINSITSNLTITAVYDEFEIEPVAKILVEEEKVGNIDKLHKSEYYMAQNQEDLSGSDTEKYYYFSSLTSAIMATTDHKELTVEDYKNMKEEEKEKTQEEIILLKDIGLATTEIVPSTKNIRIDLNERTISAKDNVDVLLQNKGILEIIEKQYLVGGIENSKGLVEIEEGAEEYIRTIIAIENEGDLTVNSCNISADILTRKTQETTSSDLQTTINNIYTNPYNNYPSVEEEEEESNIHVSSYAIYNKGNVLITQLGDFGNNEPIIGGNIFNAENANMDIKNAVIGKNVSISYDVYDSFGTITNGGTITMYDGSIGETISGLNLSIETGVINNGLFKMCGGLIGAENICVENNGYFELLGGKVGRRFLKGSAGYVEQSELGILNNEDARLFTGENAQVEANICIVNDGYYKNAVSDLKEVSYGAICQNQGTYVVDIGDPSTDVVAIIEGEEGGYATVQEAITAAEKGAVIKIVEDAFILNGLTIPEGKEITIDLNGKTIIYSSEDYLDIVKNKVTDGSVDTLIENNGILTIKDGSEELSGELIIVNSSLQNIYGIRNKNKLYFESGVLIVDNLKTVDQGQCGNAYGIENVSGDIYIGEDDDGVDRDKAKIMCMTIDLGITNSTPGAKIGVKGNFNMYDGKIYGSCSSSPANEIKGYVLKKGEDEEGKDYSLEEKTPVAEVDGEAYYTIQSAIDAVEDYEEGSEIPIIKMLANRNLTDFEQVCIPTGKKIILDLQGFAISGSKEFVIENKGNLTITDSLENGEKGKIIQTEDSYSYEAVSPWGGTQIITTNCCAIKNEGNLTVDKITIESRGDGIKNNSTLIIGRKNENENDSMNKDIPVIQGEYYAINGNSFEFYDGIIKGRQKLSNKPTIIEEKHEIVLEVIEGYEVLNLEPILAKAKISKKGIKEEFTLEETKGYEEEGYWYFYELQDAVNAVKDYGIAEDAVIVIETDIVLTKAINVLEGNKIIIDLNGKTITGSINNLGNLEIKDETGKGIIKNMSEAPIDNATAAMFTLTGGNIIGGDYAIYYGNVNIYGGTVSAAYRYDDAIYSPSGTITIGKKESINIESPVITGKITGKATETVCFYGGRVYGTFAPTPTIEGGYAIIESQDEKGITYKYLAEILSDIPVAKIGENEYNTIQSAIDAANAGDTIKILENREVLTNNTCLTVSSGKNIIIDLAGKTITGRIDNRGILTIRDSSNGDGKILRKGNSYSDSTICNNSGKLTVEGGTVEFSYASNGGGYGINNVRGTVIIGNNDGIISNTVPRIVSSFNAIYGNYELYDGRIYGGSFYYSPTKMPEEYKFGSAVDPEGKTYYCLVKIIPDEFYAQIAASDVNITTIKSNPGYYQITEDGKYYNCHTIQSAIDALKPYEKGQEIPVIKVLENRTVSGLSIGSDKTLKIDLNGKHIILSNYYAIQNSGNLTIVDNSQNGGGKIIGNDRVFSGSGEITIGEKNKEGEDIYRLTPEIHGSSSSMYKSSIKFYDGKLYGNYEFVEMEAGYGLDQGIDEKGEIYYYLSKAESAVPVAKVLKENIVSSLEDIKHVDNGEYYEFYTIQSAIDASKNGATITMLVDRKILGIGDGASITIPKGKTLTIDLNGKTISGSKKSVIENLGALKIIDSSSEKNGKIEQLLKNTSNYAYNKAITSKGILMLEGITIESKDAGVVYAYDREIKANIDIIIMNSTINAKSYGIHNEAGTVEVDETKINVSNVDSTAYGIYNYSGFVEVSNSTINATCYISTNSSLGTACGIHNETGRTHATINIENSQIKTIDNVVENVDMSAVVFGNSQGLNNIDGTVEIGRSEFVAKEGIEIHGGFINVEESKIISTKSSGIYIEAGTANIVDSEIKGQLYGILFNNNFDLDKKVIFNGDTIKGKEAAIYSTNGDYIFEIPDDYKLSEEYQDEEGYYCINLTKVSISE